MKKHLLSPFFFHFLRSNFLPTRLRKKGDLYSKIKLSLILSFAFVSLWAQPRHTFTGTTVVENSKHKQNLISNEPLLDNNLQVFKSSKKEEIERHRVWLNLTNKEGAFQQLLIGYVEGATNSWDNLYDAVTFTVNVYMDFYSINEQKKLVIQGRALPLLDTDVVPLGYRTLIPGEFTISIDHADGNLSTHAIYLEDKKTHTIHNLQTSDYNFTTTIGIFDDRFVLRYANPSALGRDDFTETEKAVLIYIKDKNINVTSAKDNISQVAVFDLTGKLLFNKEKIDKTELQISNLQSLNQILIVQTTLENKNRTSKKIIF